MAIAGAIVICWANIDGNNGKGSAGKARCAQEEIVSMPFHKGKDDIVEKASRLPGRYLGVLPTGIAGSQIGGPRLPRRLGRTGDPTKGLPTHPYSGGRHEWGDQWPLQTSVM